ncbi:unnamed protein product [Phyllotreta striolata]|uniref:DC-STAMP domain-containing protein 2 n=1 Tax=Phyllotreta striolata TaxID=444603 RepID=A0A9N9XM12_PHYSR|nr:unnamed protein product [Phyllotreta striolata]
MAFAGLVAKARSLQGYKRRLVEEKRAAMDHPKTGGRKFKFRWMRAKIQSSWRRFGRRLGYCWCCRRSCFKLRHAGSLENYALKSLLGFLSGVVLTYVFFFVLVFQLKVRVSMATVMCSVMGCVLVNGLAFSSTVRCIVLLTLPHFFSRKGRELLVAYAIALVLAGPGQNILNNLGVLNESLACGQEQLKSALRQIFEVIKKPFYAIRDAIKKVIATVKLVVKKIKEILIKIKRIIMAIIRVIKSAFMFLAKILNVCNKELGTPFERCTRVFESAIDDCNAKLGPMFNWMCSITYIVRSVCYIVKIFDVVCVIVDFISNSIIGVVVRKVKTFIRHIRTMFYVRIKFSHSFHYESKASKSVTEIAREIQGEVKRRLKTVTAVFQLTFIAAGMFIILMFIKVVLYRYRFLTQDGFDNRYVTEDFFQLDMRRARHNRETLLPLNKREEKLYVKLKSGKLTDVESKKLRKALMNVFTVTLKAALYMANDYALFWIMEMIKYYGRFQSKIQAPNVPLPHISGKGLLADLLSSIVKAFQPMGLTLEIDTVPCLPTPIPPDFDKYLQIATLLVLCWAMTVLEPYGLRFRVYILTYYHPTRGKQRAIWLYNKILRKRSSFLKFARRQLRRRFLGDKSIDKVTCKEYLAANFRIFALCFDESHPACLLCGKVYRDDDEKPIKCATPNCAGIYCEECYADLKNLCTVCLSPIEYGDFSDLSEEKDSSEEEVEVRVRREKKPWSRFLSKYCKKSTTSREEVPLVALSEASGANPFRGLIENEEDSGNQTNHSTSTNYSYSYQYDKRSSSAGLPGTSEKDVEKQAIMDYASMDNFRDGIGESDKEETTLLYYAREFIGQNDDSEERRDELIQTDGISKEKTSKQTSTTIMEKKPEKIDIGTSARSQKRIDFIGVDDSNGVQNRKKIKRKRRKRTVLYKHDTDSDDAGIEYWEKTSMIAVSKSTASTSTKKDFEKCSSIICKCKKFEEENTSDSVAISSSSELLTAVDPKEWRPRCSSCVHQEKRSRLSMFFKKVIPKYKIYHEK